VETVGSVRVLTFPARHPIRKRCPATYPPNGYLASAGHYDDDTDDEDEFQEWDDIPSPGMKYQSRLIEILATLREWVTPEHNVEEYSITACLPWRETRVSTLIPPETKEAAAKLHKEQHTLLSANAENVVCYSDGREGRSMRRKSMSA
jgi:hypothetical protein